MKPDWTDLEFADWTLLPSETALLANKTGPTRVGFAVLLKFFQYAARFPFSMQEVPTTAVAYIARQVDIFGSDDVAEAPLTVLVRAGYEYRTKARKQRRGSGKLPRFGLCASTFHPQGAFPRSHCQGRQRRVSGPTASYLG